MGVDMSTNFYLRRTKPILTFPEFHIAKRSYGWTPLYQANSKADDIWSFETERPVVNSVDDIKSYVDSGEWEIIDEYDEAISYDDFIKYMDVTFEGELAERRDHREMGYPISTDKYGNEWLGAEFS